jgi:hypothetical protein
VKRFKNKICRYKHTSIASILQFLPHCRQDQLHHATTTSLIVSFLQEGAPLKLTCKIASPTFITMYVTMIPASNEGTQNALLSKTNKAEAKWQG